MPFLIVWVIQLFIFFAIVSSVASFFSKATKSAKNQAHRADPSQMDTPIHQVQEPAEKERRNEKKHVRKNNRPVREDKYTRTPRARDAMRQQNKEIIKDVVTIKDPYETKKKKVSTSFKHKRLKQAIVYKEILDKPLSMRDE